MNASLPDPPSILLVDDEPEILNSLKSLLRREFTLHTADSGQQALEILRQQPIQVIMTDQRMPEMTGAQMLAQAKEISPQTIRIIFTGYADIKAVVDAVNEGQLFRYITKPWDPDELIETLQEAASEFHRREQRDAALEAAGSLCEDLLQNELSEPLKSNATDLLQRIREINA